jgi:hypothetical protein
MLLPLFKPAAFGNRLIVSWLRILLNLVALHHLAHLFQILAILVFSLWIVSFAKHSNRRNCFVNFIKVLISLYFFPLTDNRMACFFVLFWFGWFVKEWSAEYFTKIAKGFLVEGVLGKSLADYVRTVPCVRLGRCLLAGPSIHKYNFAFVGQFRVPVRLDSLLQSATRK